MDWQNITPEQLYVTWLLMGAFFALLAVCFDD